MANHIILNDCIPNFHQHIQSFIIDTTLLDFTLTITLKNLDSKFQIQ